MIWHFLDPWPDSSLGLALLNQRFTTSTLSNGNTALLSDLAKHGNLPYNHLLSAEDFQAYKPHPNVYLGAVEKLGLKPEECCMVAAHLGDLAAARKVGYQTLYIERKQEEQWKGAKVEEAKGWVDMWIGVDDGGFVEAARRWGIGGEEEMKVEKEAGEGVYFEGGSITGSGLGTEAHGKQRVEGHVEDPSITGQKL
jgi:2-haloacid dehalogenase